MELKLDTDAAVEKTSSRMVHRYQLGSQNVSASAVPAPPSRQDATKVRAGAEIQQ